MFILLIVINISTGQTISNDCEINEDPDLNSTILGNFIVIDHLTEIGIENVDNIIIEETLTIFNNQNDTNSLYLIFQQPYEYLTISDAEGYLLPFEFVNDTDVLDISLRSQLNSSEDIVIKMRYKLQLTLEFVPANPSYYIFQYEQYFSHLTYQYTTSVRLPIGCFIHDDENIPLPVSPVNYTDQLSGKRLYILWDHANLQAESTLGFTVFFDEPITESNLLWLYFVGSAIGMILGGLVVYIWMKRGTKQLEAEVEQIYLTKNQEMLLKIIEEKHGKITQQQLIITSKFTKSKVSRNLTPLEENGLIIKEKWGREFKVNLTKKGEKVAEKLVAKRFHNFEKIEQPDFSKEETNNIEMRKSEDK